jgi:hypothetical protein
LFFFFDQFFFAVFISQLLFCSISSYLADLSLEPSILFVSDYKQQLL